MSPRVPWPVSGCALAVAAAIGCGVAPDPPRTLPGLPAPDPVAAADVLLSPSDAAGAGPAAEAALDLDGRPLTVYVEATERGFSPSFVSIPRGQRVRLVLVNRDGQEHHLHILGLRAAGTLWLKKGSGHDHHPEEGALVSGVAGDDLAGVTGSQAPEEWVTEHPCEHFCVSGICYTKNTVHTYAAPSDTDEVVFTARDVGTFSAGDPLHPDLRATIRVF